MSACVLMNLLNELRKKDKLRGLLSIFSQHVICNQFNKMLDSIYHMTLKLLKNHISGVKTSRFCHLLHSSIMDAIR